MAAVRTPPRRTGLDIPFQAGLTAALPPEFGSALFAIEQQPAVQEELTVLRPADAAAAQTAPLEDRGSAPELTGISAWINSPPTTLAELRGKDVLGRREHRGAQVGQRRDELLTPDG